MALLRELKHSNQNVELLDCENKLRCTVLFEKQVLSEGMSTDFQNHYSSLYVELEMTVSQRFEVSCDKKMFEMKLHKF